MPLPGAVGVSGLQVYDWETPDGVCGGSPHVHLACTECYVVNQGAGRVQTLTPDGFAETTLRPGTVVWFTPGTIHRLINEGGLRITVVMQNSGLPEAGDAVLTFPADTLADPVAYARAASLDGPGHVYARDEDAARQRRDLAIAGFVELRRRTQDGDAAALKDFYAAAVQLKQDRFTDWARRWRSGPLAAAERTGEHLEQLRAGHYAHLMDAVVHALRPPSAPRLGMCGLLDVYDPAAAAGT
jgi:mannose-6-phosphate isomerase-like protein (cupin superfamily)